MRRQVEELHFFVQEDAKRVFCMHNNGAPIYVNAGISSSTSAETVTTTSVRTRVLSWLVRISSSSVGSLDCGLVVIVVYL
ncbi:hypothetical protein AVEN_2038-1 [Araneus ventricosus]|uniref:Uncharacterized protein n=1 Tax=Araneus ventricosus TaxID=182803 RepID=A0A4Y2UY67_ARAVE|nr:hypothetical protein AVEN_2038-1 [Araneus ventricosus]